MSVRMIGGFHHVFVPGDEDRPVVLALHGTGGNELDLVELARAAAPGAGILSPRGNVLENGMNRFFRRLEEGVFDLEDLLARTEELAEFIAGAKEAYRVANQKLIALGFSNGANIAASLLLQRPDSLNGAVLLRAMTPFMPRENPVLAGKRILMLSGAADPIVPAENAQKLAQLLTESGAQIVHQILPASHQMTQEDLTVTAEWFRAYIKGEEE